jgi:hypothetical protein
MQLQEAMLQVVKGNYGKTFGRPEFHTNFAFSTGDLQTITYQHKEINGERALRSKTLARFAVTGWRIVSMQSLSAQKLKH